MNLTSEQHIVCGIQSLLKDSCQVPNSHALCLSKGVTAQHKRCICQAILINQNRVSQFTCLTAGFASFYIVHKFSIPISIDALSGLDLRPVDRLTDSFLDIHKSITNECLRALFNIEILKKKICFQTGDNIKKKKYFEISEKYIMFFNLFCVFLLYLWALVIKTLYLNLTINYSIILKIQLCYILFYSQSGLQLAHIFISNSNFQIPNY